jgi:hypothetical protein
MMEYGDALTPDAFERAVSIVRELRRTRPEPLPDLAWEAASRSFCCCVTDGEDAAEGRFSDVHRPLIDAIVAMVRRSDSTTTTEDLAGWR